MPLDTRKASGYDCKWESLQGLDTAVLVMLWASSYYATNPLISTYLKRLDLSAGQ
jgi:hypothetical protein